MPNAASSVNPKVNRIVNERTDIDSIVCYPFGALRHRETDYTESQSVVNREADCRAY
jgi:hypothetical protein